MRSLARMYVWWPSIDSDIEKSVRRCTECQNVQSTSPVAPLKVGDSVLVRNYVGNRKWLNGVVKSQTGPVSFKVLVNGQLRRCHLDQLKLRLCNSDSNS